MLLKMNSLKSFRSCNYLCLIQPDGNLVKEVKSRFRSRQQLSLQESSIQVYIEWLELNKLAPGKPTFVLLTGETPEQFMSRHGPDGAAVVDEINWHDEIIEPFLK